MTSLRQALVIVMNGEMSTYVARCMQPDILRPRNRIGWELGIWTWLTRTKYGILDGCNFASNKVPGAGVAEDQVGFVDALRFRLL